MQGDVNKYEHLDKEDPDVLRKLILHHLYFEVLNWCGCGSPITALSVVKRYLWCLDHNRYFEDETKECKSATELLENLCKSSVRNDAERERRLNECFGVRDIYENELLLCFAYNMDDKGLTEHGTSTTNSKS